MEAAGGTIVDVDRFTPNAGAVAAPAGAVAKTGADAVLIAQGGAVLRAIAPTMTFDGATSDKMQLLGTGLWDDDPRSPGSGAGRRLVCRARAQCRCPFIAKYRAAFGTAPAQLASLAYDAVSLVALLSPGTPYHRFTHAALMDPNGFAGVNGIFRFHADGTSERGLAVLEMTPDGPSGGEPRAEDVPARSALIQQVPRSRG